MRLSIFLFTILSSFGAFAQPADAYLSLILGDAMREANVPGAACAVITSDSIRYGVTGVVAMGSETLITPLSLFHIGSCTKSITGFVAARAVKEELIKWDTKFFDLFPEVKASSRPEYADITLADLLSHQAWLQAFTSGSEFKKLPEYPENDPEARLKFAQHVLSQKPVKHKESYKYSNAGYALATLMIEKVTSKTWENLVAAYFLEQGWKYQLGYAAYTDKGEPAGHYRKKGRVKQIEKSQNFDIPSYLAPAGDVSMRTVDYAKYLQQHLSGLQNGDDYLSKAEYRNLHFRNEEYALGWGHGKIKSKDIEITTHSGSAGAFLAMMVVVPSEDLAVLVVANMEDPKSDEAIKSVRNRILREQLN